MPKLQVRCSAIIDNKRRKQLERTRVVQLPAHTYPVHTDTIPEVRDNVEVLPINPTGLALISGFQINEGESSVLFVFFSLIF